MTQSEIYLISQLEKAFSDIESVDVDLCYKHWKDIPDKWILDNSDAFFYFSNPNEIFLLPAFLCFLLRNFKESFSTPIYMYIESTLREYSKDKRASSFKYRINDAQFSAIRGVIKHYLHNQPANIDEESWSFILKRWVR